MKKGDFIHNPESGGPDVYIEYKGIFDMQDLYESIADFFFQKKFKFYEKQQRHRRPGPFGPEISYEFVATREIEDYYMWTVDTHIETFDVHDVDVVTKDGTKKKVQKGRIWVQIVGVTSTDPHHVWEKTAFLAHLKSFYNKYVIRKKFEGVWWDEMYYNVVLRLHAVIKERLRMASEVYEHRHFDRTH